MKSIIITKWVEPYKLLETIKDHYAYSDFTFDGINKNIEKQKFLKGLENSNNTVGLYMKNVNKYYLFSKESNFDIWNILIEKFSFTPEDFEMSDDINKPFDMIDLGKAEASLIFT